MSFASGYNNTQMDKFGIREIYPTIEGGREWFLNMQDPKIDKNFIITFNHSISRQIDGSWQISDPVVRMNVITLASERPWKNVEITGYAKIIKSISNSSNVVKDNDLSWYARGNKHNQNSPCDGTAYIGGIYENGVVGWKKEIWFTGGYTNERGSLQVTDELLNRWIGWKVIIYNENNDSTVKLDSYIDNLNNNYWVKVTDLRDDGGWYAKTKDSQFFSVECNRDKDHIIIDPGPIVTFRSDNLVWHFKNLSVREIHVND